MPDNSVIFDFETLSTDRVNCPVLNMAMLSFDSERFLSGPYTYKSLIEKCKFIKFNVEDQVKNWGRKIDQETLNWWGAQSADARKQMIPTPYDQGIDKLFDFWQENKPDQLSRIYTRGNNFDPIIMDYILEQTGYDKNEAYKFYQFRDTRSTIDALAWGHNLNNSFIPEGLEEHFVAHDPKHDIAMDVMRMQTLVKAIS